MILEKLKRLSDDDFVIEEILNDDETHDAFQAEVLQYANENRTKFEEFIKNLHHEEDEEALETIYDILSEEADNWGSFLINEYKRWFEFSEKYPEKADDITFLIDIDLTKHETSANEVIHFLSEKIDHPNNKIRQEAIWLMADYLNENQRYKKHPKSIEKLKKRLNDEKQKIRLLTIKTLKKNSQLPKYYKPRLLDRIALKMQERKEKKTQKFIDQALKNANIHVK